MLKELRSSWEASDKLFIIAEHMISAVLKQITVSGIVVLVHTHT